MAHAELLLKVVAEKLQGIDESLERSHSWYEELAVLWGMRLLEGNIGEQEALSDFLSMDPDQIQKIAAQHGRLASTLEAVLPLLRSMVRRPECPEGKTIPSGFSLASHMAMKQVVPVKPPMLQVGQWLGRFIISGLRASLDSHEDWWAEIQGTEATRQFVARIFRGTLGWNGMTMSWDQLIDNCERQRLTPGPLDHHKIHNNSPTIVDLIEAIDMSEEPKLLLGMESLYPFGNMCGGKKKTIRKNVIGMIQRMRESLGDLSRLGSGIEFSIDTILIDESGKLRVDPWRSIQAGSQGNRDFQLSILMARYLAGAGAWEVAGNVLAKFARRYRTTTKHLRLLFPSVDGLNQDEEKAVRGFRKVCRRNHKIKRGLKTIYSELLQTGTYAAYINHAEYNTGEGGIAPYLVEKIESLGVNRNRPLMGSICRKCVRLKERYEFKRALASRFLEEDWFCETTDPESEQVRILADIVKEDRADLLLDGIYVSIDISDAVLKARIKHELYIQQMNQIIDEINCGAVEFTDYDCEDGLHPIIRDRFGWMPMNWQRKIWAEVKSNNRRSIVKSNAVKALLDRPWFTTRKTLANDTRILKIIRSIDSQVLLYERDVPDVVSMAHAEINNRLIMPIGNFLVLQRYIRNQQIHFDGKLCMLTDYLQGLITDEDNIVDLMKTVIINFLRTFGQHDGMVNNVVPLNQLCELFIRLRFGFYLQSFDFQKRLLDYFNNLHNGPAAIRGIPNWYSGFRNQCEEYAGIHQEASNLVVSITDPDLASTPIKIEFIWVRGTQGGTLETSHGQQMGFWISRRPLSYREFYAIKFKEYDRQHANYCNDGNQNKLDNIAENNKVSDVDRLIWYMNYRAAHGESLGIQIEDASFSSGIIDSSCFHFRLPSKEEWQMGANVSGFLCKQNLWDLTRSFVGLNPMVCSQTHPAGISVRGVWGQQWIHDDPVFHGLCIRLIVEPIYFPVTL